MSSEDDSVCFGDLSCLEAGLMDCTTLIDPRKLLFDGRSD